MICDMPVSSLYIVHTNNASISFQSHVHPYAKAYADSLPFQFHSVINECYSSHIVKSLSPSSVRQIASHNVKGEAEINRSYHTVNRRNFGSPPIPSREHTSNIVEQRI